MSINRNMSILAAGAGASNGLALGGATIGTNALAVTGTAIISGNTGIGTTSPQTLLTLNAGTGQDGTGEATYHGLIQLDGYYTGTSDLSTVSGIEWKTAYGSNGSGFRQTGLYNSGSGASTLVFAGRQASAAWTTLMTLTGDGNLSFASGTRGIIFNNSSALTNSTLNDYETGSWTPVIKFGGTTCTSSTSSATYVKIGKLVHCNISAQTLTATPSGAGAFELSGLPFTSMATAYSFGIAQWNASTMPAGFSQCQFYVTASTATARILRNSNTGHSDIIGTDLANTAVLYGSFTYQATF